MAARKTKPSKKSRSTPKPASTAARRLPEATRDQGIDEYLARASPRSRALLQQLRKTIHAVVPDVEECISYRIPAFRFEGRIIAGFSATSNGCSYYPFSGATLEALAGDVVGYSQTKSALHFDEPLPTAIVRKLLEARIAEGRGRSTRRAST